ncbi:FAD-dependent oxidoreductase [Sporomusa malonica]|uniref:Protoporphyrinogen oxidase n=1 Tax=Sporomusa malonica TaxID=112901 RepID=A0A1W2CXM3_9FIRM|nr:FAD-dependent oxidoreductase [Sporomusa malonica]SMC89448.1 Protoporphyrinogen oxidase [Sporomusa malonica]
MNQYYDAVIIGAGLSGLAAAWELAGMKIAVLEKEAAAGGRVKTGAFGSFHYDLGAIFRLESTLLPFALGQHEIMDESEKVGLLYNGQLFFGTGVMSCIGSVGGRLREEARSAFYKFHEDQTPDYNTMSQDCQEVLSAFFQVIHPGELSSYIPTRQRDACVKHSCSHLVSGNAAIIDSFLSSLGSKCELWLNTEVEAVIQETGIVRIICNKAGERQELLARTVLVTVPAPLARTMITQIDSPSQAFLKSLAYGAGVVVAVGIKGASIPDFAYLVTPQLSTSTIIQHHTLDKQVRVLLVYYAGAKAAALKTMTDDVVVEGTIQELINLEFCQRQQIIFTDIQRWDYLGPIINTQSYGQWDKQAVKPSAQVFLAGEYVAVADGRDIMPYGMAAALQAGAEQGRAARALLEAAEDFVRYQDTFLVDVYTYRLDGSRPVFIKHSEEGNIAFYGLILQATGDIRLQQYLISASLNGLWEYQTGFGVTAEDSALVLEGLWETGTDRQFLLRSLEKLVEQFYDQDAGAFCTIRKGRAKYWQGASADATGMIGYLLACLAPTEYQSQIAACVEHVRRTQNEQGFWRGKWFPSYLITTWYSLRLLSAVDTENHMAAMAKAVSYVLKKQQDNGSWNLSVIDTAAALLTLRQAKSANNKSLPALHQAMLAAKHWLIHSSGKRPCGEPVLYYLFEEENWLQERLNHTLFFHCQDKGQIAAAWRQLALRGGNEHEK